MIFKCVAEIMSPSLMDVEETESVYRVIQLFEQVKISGVPVVNADGDYVGVVSKTDLVCVKLLNLIQERVDLEHIQVRELMNSQPPLCVKESDSIAEVIEVMDYHQIHRVFVMNEFNRITGIVTTLDIVSRLRPAIEACS